MKIEMRPITEIKPYPNNPRINDDAVDTVAGSIREFGFRQPIVVDEDGFIICGHTRFKAAQKLQMETVPVHVAKDLSPDQIKAYRIADNKTAELAEWNYDLLPIELGELQASGFDLSLLGFDGDELLKLLSTEIEEGLTDPDDVPAPPDAAVTQPGDLWILGNHRLLCGDSSKPEDLDRLLGGETIQLVNTDPPYNVKVEPRSNNAIAAGLIAQCPPGPWPNAWGTWDNTIEAHRRLVDQYIDNLRPSRVTYAQERGIVIAGGGLKYFPSVWVNVNLLRHFGCTLPIQLWYLGDTEMDPYMKRLLEPLGVECIDAREIEKQHPCRILCGWELKLFATLHSPFAQVLFLDADNGVVCDPTYLFECDEYKRHGAVFWPDYACWTLKPGVWRVFGMYDMAEPEVAEHERAFESGQYLIDKRRCDRELRLSLFYAEHSDFTFQHVYGDKECFHLGWRRLASDYAMPSAGPGWNVHTIVQFDFRGQIVFQHRCQDKWRFGGNRFVDSLANEELCFQLVRDLASKWSGNLWKNEAPTTMETETIEQLINTRVLYRRVGYDQRVIKLGPNREVIEGAAECERLWHVNHVDGEPVLTFARLDRPTCHLRRDHEGIWRGSWLEYERMPIEVIPEVQWKPTVDAIDPTKSRLLITVATGDSFQELLRYTGPLMEAYAKRIGADFVAITKPTQDWWGLEKFRVFPFAQSYERTLYVDADVFLTDETPDLFDVVPVGHVSMHDDWSLLPSFEWVFEERRNILESQEIPMDYSKVVLNSGIVMSDRKHAHIWKPPLRPFFPTHCSEQFWIQNNARGLPFFQLPIEFNTQYWMPNFRDLVPTAKVIHLANCPPAKRLELARQFTSSLATA